MNGYYPMDQPGSGENMMGVMNQDEMSPSMMGGQSLDDIVNQNSKAMRRQSVPVHYASGRQPDLEGDMRRVSMLEFSGAAPGQLDQFQFDPATAAPNIDGMMSVGDAYTRRNSSYQRRRPSAGDLSLDTRLHNSQASFTNIPSHGSYASPLAPTTGMDMGITSPYHSSGLPINIDLTDPSLSMMNTGDGTPMNMYSQPQFASPLIGSPITQDFADSMQAMPDPGGSGGPGSMDLNVGSETQSMTPDIRRRDSREHSAPQSAHSNHPQDGNNTMPQAPDPHSARNGTYGPERTIPQSVTHMGPQFPWATPPGGFPSTMQNRPHMETQFKNVYSSTGFDMLGVLMRVATRPKPEINIGSVDLSCAFVVCDAEKDDFPIVYCSENFERLTGYTRHMILGRNCRFLQSPDGKVEAGTKRKYVDDDSVLYLKNMITARKEAQISLINYRRGGQPFMNLLTMIPITWDDSEQTKFFVGFQVDLVEQPNSVTNKNPDGTYSINYQRAIGMPRYVFNTPESTQAMEMGQTIPRDDVSALLDTLVNGENEASKRLWDKALLENTDDVIHVLSLKGLFLYLSPSAARVLEYEASELVGTALSSVCHPSDIVPVTRELKDTSAGSAVNVVFRIRRKHSGYMWFEGHGSLHTEQGKGRKCIILVGRERPVYALSKRDIDSNGGIGDNELWTKMSTSGMFLFVASNVRSLLDRQPDDLVGTSIQALMRQESKQEFHRILEMARTGKKASVKHEMMNKRGQVLQAFTTIYPGDAVEGQKPTFVIAQTRLLKFSRGSASANNRPSIYPKHERDSGSSIATTGSTPTHTINTGSTHTPGSLAHGMSVSQYVTTDGNAMTYAGQNGLKLGHQDASLASEDNVFEELKTTRSTSWQYELRQMEKRNRLLAEEVQSLLAAKKKRKRRKGAGQLQKDCANCHTRVTPEWRRGPSGNRDLCNSCGLRWAKQNGRVSPRAASQHSAQSGGSDKASKHSASPLAHSQTVNNDMAAGKGEHTSSKSDTIPAKVAKTDAAASQGLGPAAVGASIPPKIDEDSEEPD
ncbi:PAS domain-containing protein [Macrophomina phaseolina MS6]|uniref:PAS domain-containing protein n=1 Tax=Macrophomina phaseolina (strain MS6) TaxID=1126212 RepID=K2QKU3_MACPH|nr:PAS domain-containing protein [Macrophomina phaseolina MS6]